MITTINLELEVKNEIQTQPQSFTGYLTRGMIYTILRNNNPEYAEQLHTEKGKPAPFSIKPPYTLTLRKIKIYASKIPANIIFNIQATTLEDRLANLLCNALISQQEEVLSLSQTKAKILSLSISQVTPQQLQEATAIDKFTVSFLTPTYFRVHIPRGIRKAEQVRVLPLPDPVHMFTNLYNIWNAYLKPRVGEDYLEWLQQHSILISRLRNIKTHRYYEHPVKGVFAIGFTGTAYYTLAEDTYDKKMAKITHQLLKMAEYTNVGGNRTAGYGWITYRAKPPEEEK